MCTLWKSHALLYWTHIPFEVCEEGQDFCTVQTWIFPEPCKKLAIKTSANTIVFSIRMLMVSFIRRE